MIAPMHIRDALKASKMGFPVSKISIFSVKLKTAIRCESVDGYEYVGRT